ncbi:MAG: prolyl oligopeptidase family serine peptidase [Anaerolineae bacterium]|nr:prolyl oligopeptidase family serine peptidase [Anaerolineae bacterium]
MKRSLCIACLCSAILAVGLIFSPAASAQGDPTPAPTRQVVAPGLYNITTASGGIERRFILHVPGSYTPGTPMPLVFVFHGRGSSAEETFLFSQMSDKAEQIGFFAVYPEGLGSPQQWSFLVGAQERGEPDDLQFVRDLITLMSQRLDVDPQRIYAAGISNGGGMANYLACNLSDQVAAIAQVAGMYPVPEIILGSCTPNRPIPVMTIHGEADQVLPYDGISGYLLAARSWATDWAGRNGCEDDPEVTFEQGEVTGETWTHCQDNADVVLYTVETGDHTWFYDTLPENLDLRIPATDISAADAIWEFFAAHPMPESPSFYAEATTAEEGGAAEEIADWESFVPEPGSFTIAIESGGLVREYLLHIPTGYEDGMPVPLVLNFHGYGSNPREHEAYTGMSEKADEAGFIVVYPLGFGRPAGWFFWANGPRDGEPDDVQFTIDLIDALSARLSIDPARIYAAGFSNGGGMAGWLACRLSNRIAAAVQVAGTYPVYERCVPERPVPAMAIHGDADDVLPYKGQIPSVLSAPDWSSHWADRNGCQTRNEVTYEEGSVTGRTWSDCLDDADVILYTIAGGGHAWPDGEFSATDAVWDFFEAHKLPDEPSAAREIPFADPSAALEPVDFTPTPGDYTGEIMSARMPRRYLVHVPPGYVHGEPMPLVLNFHGLGATPRGEMLLSQMSDQADAEGFIVVYPEGYGDTFERRGWFYLPTSTRTDQDELPYDVQFIRDLIDVLPRFLSIDPARIYATGMSNGAGFANRLGCDLAGKIAAISGVSGAYQYGAPCRPSRPLPVMILHGKADQIAPYGGTATVSYPVPDLAAQWSARNGCASDSEVFYEEGAVTGQAWSGCLDDAEVVLYTIEDGGHTWPGGTPFEASIDMGLTSTEISANDAMWDFFMAHSMPEEPSQAVEIPEDDELLLEPDRGDTSVQPGDYRATLESGGHSREHLLHVPPSYDPATPISVVIAYHGYGDEAVNFLVSSDLMRKADEAGFLLVVPAGFGEPRGWASRPDEDADIDDVQFTRDLIEHLKQWFNIDPARIYVTGFSNGGGMAHRLGCELADVLAAIAPVGGSYPIDNSWCEPSRPVPVLSIHGKADDVAPYGGGRGRYANIQAWAAEWAARNGCDAAPATSEEIVETGGISVDVGVQAWEHCKADVILQTYEDWGHYWPPGAGPDAIWDFFESHPMPTGDDDTPPVGTSTGEIESQGVTRSYRLYVPTTYDPNGDPVPLVVNLHGLASNVQQQEQFSQMSKKAEEIGFVVVYPQGVSIPARWYVAPARTERSDVAFIRDLVAHLQSQLNIDPARIYATGFSNGGGMTNRLACDAADLFAAVAPVSGAYNYADDCEPSRSVPVLAFHGRADMIVRYEGQPDNFALGSALPPIPEWAAAWAARNGCDEAPEVTVETYEEGDLTIEMWGNCAGGAGVSLYTIDKLNHVWPGGPGIPILGFDGGSVPATDIIWAFFEAHPMPGAKAD